ncbi:MAG TPA: PaaI family thioesterase [Acidimicrobiales bacterium]|nr:PaaI family thioesterase [Acidimicrobiales bacterium]
MTTTGAGESALSDEQQQQMRRAVPDAMLQTPYVGWLGPVFEHFGPDEVVMRLPFRHELTNDGARYHGGVVAALMDTTAAAAAWSNHDFSKGTRASTVSMSVQYVGAADRSDLLCRARVVRRGRELTFVDITVTDTADKLLAHGLQTYRIV